jgi:hypothetical protein
MSSSAGSAERPLSSSCSPLTLMILPCARPAEKMTRASSCPLSLAAPPPVQVKVRAKVHTPAPLMAVFLEVTDGCRELPGKSPLRVRPLNPSISSPLMGEGKGGGEKDGEHPLAFLASPSPLSPAARGGETSSATGIRGGFRIVAWKTN